MAGTGNSTYSPLDAFVNEPPNVPERLLAASEVCKGIDDSHKTTPVWQADKKASKELGEVNDTMRTPVLSKI